MPAWSSAVRPESCIFRSRTHGHRHLQTICICKPCPRANTCPSEVQLQLEVWSMFSGPTRLTQARDCIAACKCIAPHNCGVHNNTISCGVSIIGCSVCDVCCEPWITAQSSCDGFFEAPVPNGCGNQTNQPTPAPTPVVAYGCNSTTGPKRITVARRMQCNLQATDPRSNTKSYTSADASADTHDVQLQHNDGALRGGPARPAIAGRVHRHLQAVTPIPSLLSLSLG